MNIKPCKFCGRQPWQEADLQYEDDTVSEIFVYLECSKCRAQTKSFPKSEQAVEAWQNGEYTQQSAQQTCTCPPNGHVYDCPVNGIPPYWEQRR